MFKNKEMKHYNLLHNMEKYGNYSNDLHKKSYKDRRELANYIHENYNTMDETEMKIIAMKCLDINKIKHILLNFEIKNFKQEPFEQLSLDKFKLYAVNIFNRYQHKAGGFCVEDREWIIHDNTSKIHKVAENELMFENTISIIDDNDMETENYLLNLIKQLSYIAENIKIEWKQKHVKKSKVTRVWIWAVDKNKVVSDGNEIGL